VMSQKHRLLAAIFGLLFKQVIYITSRLISSCGM